MKKVDKQAAMRAEKRAAEMKTYAIDRNGEPKLVLRFRDDAQAAQFVRDGEWEGLHGFDDRRSAKVTVRPATIAEQAAWRALSVRMELGYEAHPSADEIGPDDYILELDRP